jgi:hypothetical protein
MAPDAVVTSGLSMRVSSGIVAVLLAIAFLAPPASAGTPPSCLSSNVFPYSILCPNLTTGSTATCVAAGLVIVYENIDGLGTSRQYFGRVERIAANGSAGGSSSTEYEEVDQWIGGVHVVARVLPGDCSARNVGGVYSASAEAKLENLDITGIAIPIHVWGLDVKTSTSYPGFATTRSCWLTTGGVNTNCGAETSNTAGCVTVRKNEQWNAATTTSSANYWHLFYGTTGLHVVVCPPTGGVIHVYAAYTQVSARYDAQ